ncbi:MAG: hypothetical protein INR73_24075 [Williamsia sp.]|nr:hypothetical protein [Williamsia sp.]
MDYESALALKKSISEEVIRPAQRKIARIFSVASPGSMVRSIRLSRELRTGVNGVGIAATENRGYQLKILTRSNGFSSVKAVAAYYNLRPGQLTIKQAGPIRLLFRTDRYRPPVPGISIGHYLVSAGTLGCVVKKKNEDGYYILSNNHVLANGNESRIGDPVLQPGKLDGGQSADVIARLADYEPLVFNGDNFYDAAIARLDIPVEPGSIPGIGTVTETAPPVANARVRKLGRSSELTAGQIVSKSIDIEVDFGNDRKLVFKDQFEIEGRNGEDGPIGFSLDGDSGSLVVEAENRKAVGLLFAGDDTGSSYASPIMPILSRFGVFLV